MKIRTDAMNDHIRSLPFIRCAGRKRDGFGDIEGLQDHRVDHGELLDQEADFAQLSRDAHHEPYGESDGKAPPFDDGL